MDYFNFLAAVLLPLLLGAYGAHLAAIVLDGKGKTKAIWTVWSLAGACILTAAIQQYRTYHSDKIRDDKQATLQTNLDSIGSMIRKIAERTNDPELERLAKAIDILGETRKVSEPNALSKKETVLSWTMRN